MFLIKFEFFYGWRRSADPFKVCQVVPRKNASHVALRDLMLKIFKHIWSAMGTDKKRKKCSKDFATCDINLGKPATYLYSQSGGTVRGKDSKWGIFGLLKTLKHPLTALKIPKLSISLLNLKFWNKMVKLFLFTWNSKRLQAIACMETAGRSQMN